MLLHDCMYFFVGNGVYIVKTFLNARILSDTLTNANLYYSKLIYLALINVARKFFNTNLYSHVKMKLNPVKIYKNETKIILRKCVRRTCFKNVYKTYMAGIFVDRSFFVYSIPSKIFFK